MKALVLAMMGIAGLAILVMGMDSRLAMGATPVPTTETTSAPSSEVAGLLARIAALEANAPVSAKPLATSQPGPSTKPRTASAGIWLSTVSLSDPNQTALFARLKVQVPTPSGVMVTNVVPGGPAANSGLRTADIIRSLDGRSVSDAQSFLRAIAALQVGQKCAIMIDRLSEKPDASGYRLWRSLRLELTAGDFLALQAATQPAGPWAGFRGISWGTNMDQIDDLRKLAGEGKATDLVLCSRLGDKMKIGQANLESVFYGFYNGKFATVVIYCTGRENFAAVKAVLQETYGDPDQPNQFIEYFVWTGRANARAGEVRMALHYDGFARKATVIYLYQPLMEQQIKDQKAAAKDGGKDL